MVVVSANWETQWAEAWQAHILRSRACENSISVRCRQSHWRRANHALFGRQHVGGTISRSVHSVGRTNEGYAIATIDLDQVRKVREDRQLIQYRELELRIAPLLRNIDGKPC